MERGQRDAVGRIGGSQFRYERHTLPDGDHRQDRGEVVDVVAHARGESGRLAGPDGHRVAQRAGSGGDPGRLAAGREHGRVALSFDGIRGGQVHDLVEERHGVQGEVGLGRDEVVLVDQGDIELTGAQPGRDLGGVDLVHHRIETRVAARERRQGRGQDRAGRRGKGTDPHGPGQVRTGRGELRRRLLQPFEHRLGVPHQRHVGGGERDPPSAAFEQGDRSPRTAKSPSTRSKTWRTACSTTARRGSSRLAPRRRSPR